MIEAFSFVTPLALLGLFLLPLIWWLLKFTPPRPQTVHFAPFRLLADLAAREEDTDKTPWWLILLRLLLLGLAIIAVAGPLYKAGPAGNITNQPVLIVADNGWAAAAGWTERARFIDEIITAAERSGNSVALTGTVGQNTAKLLPAREARQQAATLAAQALEPQRPATAQQLQQSFGNLPGLRVIWLSDGLGQDSGKAFAESLAALAGGKAELSVILPEKADLPAKLTPPKLEDGDISITAQRALKAEQQQLNANLLARNGRFLGEAELVFEPGEIQANGRISLPLELRNEAAILRLEGAEHAGGVFLFDDRWRRRVVALISGTDKQIDQPLLSPLYYVQRALEPSAEISLLRQPDDLRERIAAGLSMLIMADVGVINRSRAQLVRKWVEDGGVLVRFAGPRLAGGADDLVPVELRSGGRALGSALSWEQPQHLAPFAETSPFNGLTVDPDVIVSRQVLAEPTSALTNKVWASLADGTPLVTAAPRGNGMVVLVHVTANADWSNLALSGMFVEMLQRLLQIAPGAAAPGGNVSASLGNSSAAFVPARALSGEGRLVAPAASATPIAAADFATTRPSPAHPAGIYKRNSRNHALNIVDETPLTVLDDLPAGISTGDYRATPPVDLAPYLFLAAVVLFLIDCIAMLSLFGAWSRLRKPAAASAIFLTMLVFSGTGVEAQQNTQAENDDFALRSVSETRFAYVKTGDSEVDEVSFAGLTGLSDVLLERTSVEAGLPVAVDIESDEIVFFPLVYWPILADAPELSEKTIEKIDVFMKNGGTIFFDTRDQQTNVTAFNDSVSPATQALRRLLRDLDVPPLEPVPETHVLTKAFYLLQSFPGRWAGGPLWVEATPDDGKPVSEGNSDGVTSIIIGSNDYAGAWAASVTGQPLFPTVPGGARQREFAYRTGVNIVMYTLTGNYKADQVHIPALLERLGQ